MVGTRVTKGLARRAALLCAVAFAAASPTGSAFAAEPGGDLALTWDAPSACPSRADALAAIRTTLGDAGPTAPLRAHVALSPSQGDRWVAHVRLGDGDARGRRIEGESCRAVADAAELVVAMAMNPNAELAAPPSAPLPAPPPRDAAEASPLPNTPPEPQVLATVSLPRAPGREDGGAEHAAPSAPLPVRLHGTGGVGLMSGLLAKASPDVALRVGARVGRLSGDVGGALTPNQRQSLDARPNEGATLGLVRVDARACIDAVASEVSVGPCVLGGIAWVHADGFGADVPASATARIAVGGAGVAATWRLSPHWAAIADGFAVAPFTRPSFVIDPAGSVHKPSAIGLDFAMGLRFHY